MHSVTSNAVALALSSAIVAHEVSSSNTDFIMIKLPTGDYIGIGWNKAQYIASGTTTGISIATPSGYTLKKLINGDAFAEGNASYVRRAMHASSGNVYMYLDSGTYNAGYIRVQALYSKNS